MAAMVFPSLRSSATVVVALLGVPLARADVYQVGPGRPYTQLEQVLTAVNLQPGDVVEVDGNQTYAPVLWDEGGEAGNPVTIRACASVGTGRSWRVGSTPSSWPRTISFVDSVRVEVTLAKLVRLVDAHLVKTHLCYPSCPK